MNAISSFGHMRIPTTPLDKAKEEPWDSEETKAKKKEIADLLRKQGGKGWQELVNLMPQLRFIRSPFGFTFNTLEGKTYICLLYTSPSPRDKRQSRMPSSA